MTDKKYDLVDMRAFDYAWDAFVGVNNDDGIVGDLLNALQAYEQAKLDKLIERSKRNE